MVIWLFEQVESDEKGLLSVVSTTFIIIPHNATKCSTLLAYWTNCLCYKEDSITATSVHHISSSLHGLQLWYSNILVASVSSRGILPFLFLKWYGKAGGADKLGNRSPELQHCKFNLSAAGISFNLRTFIWMDSILWPADCNR